MLPSHRGNDFMQKKLCSHKVIYDILLTNIWYITLQYMIYYFAIYDILLHNIWYITSWKHSLGSIGACLCKQWSTMVPVVEHDGASSGARWCQQWSTMVEALEHDVANAGIWLCGANAIASAHASSLFMRSGEDFFVKKFGNFGKTKYFCREIHSWETSFKPYY